MTTGFRERRQRRLRLCPGCGSAGALELETGGSTALASGQLTPNFHIREFASKDGVAVPTQYHANVRELAQNLQQLRNHIGRAVTVTSGYRTPAHNATVGGAPRSQHLLARAADIRVAGIAPPALYCTIEALIADGRMKAGGLGIYNSFVHYDTRGRNDRWTGTGVSRPSCRDAARTGSAAASTDAHAGPAGVARNGAGAPVSGAAAGAAVQVLTHRRRANWDEDGLYVRATTRFTSEPGNATDRILGSMAAAEGGFDTVNMYDRGIVSWGIMQWTAHAGSLQRVLAFVRRRLGELNQSDLWPRLFPELDVRQAAGSTTLLHRGQPVVGEAALRNLFRGSPEKGKLQADVARRWATVFAMAGRNLVIQQLQREHARSEVARATAVRLGPTLAGFKRVQCARRPALAGVWPAVCRELRDPAEAYAGRYARVADYLGGDVRAGALYFGMWTNNPAMTYVHIKRAIDRFSSSLGSTLPDGWPAGWQPRFAAEFERVLRGSSFGYWGDAKAAAAKRTSRTAKILKNLGT